MIGKIKRTLEYQNSFFLLFELFKVLSSKRKKQLFLSFFVIVFASISEIFTVYLILPFTSLLLNRDGNFEVNSFYKFLNNIGFNYKDSIYSLGFLLIFFIISSSLLRLINLWINIKLTQRISGELSYESYKKTLYKPYSFHIGRNSSVIISALNKSIEGTSTAIDAALQFVSSITIISAILIGLSLVNFKITLVSLSIFLILYLGIFILTKNVLYSNSRYSVKKNSLRFRELLEGLSAIREIIIDGNQEYFIRNFSIVDKQLRNKIIQNGFIIGSPRYLFECISILIIISISLFFLNDNNLKYNSLSYLATFALGAQKILPLIQTIYRMVSNIRAKKFEVVDIIRMMNSKVSTKTRTKKIYNFKNSILLKNIDFSYKKNVQVLKEVNLTINKGDKVGIIGSTGSGKSTLLDIIMGLLKPTKGEIIVDEVNIISSTKNSQIHKWRSCISHVPQNIFIADASFAENIAFGLYKDQIDMRKVIECSRKAMIEDLILKSEKKYNTNLGEGGVKLSGGQKQRIGIARALYKNSQVLVLDEATSALDNKTEKDVMKTIKNLHEITVLIVTHRPSTIKYCDKIIEIENGKIINS